MKCRLALRPKATLRDRLRNLVYLTELGVLETDARENLERPKATLRDRIEQIINNQEHLLKGRRHPTEALAEYRQKLNPNLKALYVTLTPYRITLVDPKDSLSWDLGGFDPGVRQLIQMLASGEIEIKRYKTCQYPRIPWRKFPYSLLVLVKPTASLD